MAMQHYNWLIDPATGDYVVTNGNPVSDTTVQFPAYLRLKLQRNSWLYAEGDNYGSDFNLVKKRTSNVQQLLQAVATRALEPLREDGRVATIEVESAGSARHAEILDITLTENNRETVQFVFEPVGT